MRQADPTHDDDTFADWSREIANDADASINQEKGLNSSVRW